MNAAWLFTLMVAAEPLPAWREAIIAGAERYATWPWQMTADNQRCGEVDAYQSDFPLGPQVGVPYQWGGFDTPDEFAAAVAQGRAAGAHLEHSPTALPCATGVDCSGLVSRLWGLPEKQSTRTLSEHADPITRGELSPGDVLNKPGSHVVIFAGLREDGAPLYYEASGAVGKVHLETLGSWAKLDGYQPLRLRPEVGVAAVAQVEVPPPVQDPSGGAVDPDPPRPGRRRVRRGPPAAPSSITCHCVTAQGEPPSHLNWGGVFLALSLFRRPRK